MTPGDRAAAQSKLDNMIFQIAYPTTAEDARYWPSQTTFLDGLLGQDLFTNYMLSVRLQVQHNFKYIDYPPSRRSWSETPLAVNAFYSKGSNGLWIPAGILQPPFFDAAHPDARNFGSIGCILGHEMSHGFDDQGRRFNADGDLHEWWSAQTVTKYLERAACLVTLFSSYPVGDRFVDGNLTIGENMADLGGVKFSFLAFAASRKRSAEDHRVFFTSYAQSWCAVLNKEAEEKAVITDEHAPSKYRVIGPLSQFAPFAHAFQCASGSRMAPERRCSLW